MDKNNPMGKMRVSKTISLPIYLIAKLHEISEKEGKSISRVVEELLLKALNEVKEDE